MLSDVFERKTANTCHMRAVLERDMPQGWIEFYDWVQ
jgi:hypothetical protein